MRCECGRRKCDLDSGEHRLPVAASLSFSAACRKLLRPLKSPLAAHGVVGKLPTTAERPALLAITCAAGRAAVWSPYGFVDGRNTASRSVHNHLRCRVARLYLITHSFDFRILFFGVHNDSFYFVL